MRKGNASESQSTTTPPAIAAPKPEAYTVKILPCEKGSPNGKLADAEVHFTHPDLAGMKLLGFAVWNQRTGPGRNVTFPARTYSVNGERRSFSLLRPATASPVGQDKIRAAILAAYEEFLTQTAVDQSHN